VRAAALLPAALAAALCLAAGCLAPRPEGGEEAAAWPPPTVLRTGGLVVASGPMVAVPGGDTYAFAVAANVTLLLAEIRWDDPVQDLDLALASPSAGGAGRVQNFDHAASGGSPGSPDSPHSLEVDVPETGEWRASAFGNGAAAAVEYRLALTLFHGESDVPAGYTALKG
jgi:hypothetical protein